MTVHPCTMAGLPFICWRTPEIPFVAPWVRPPAPHGPGCPCLPPWFPVLSGQTYGTWMSIWLELLNRCWHFVNHPVNFSSPKSQQLVPLKTWTENNHIDFLIPTRKRQSVCAETVHNAFQPAPSFSAAGLLPMQAWAAFTSYCLGLCQN